MKVWISKYALSGDGITEHDVPGTEGNGRHQYVYPGAPFMSFTSFKLGTEAHLDRASAVATAETARVKKIASLQKQIAKLKTMSFEPKESKP